MKKIFGRPESLTDFPYPYCPGCGHGIVQRLVGEAMDQLDIVGIDRSHLRRLFGQELEAVCL